MTWKNQGGCEFRLICQWEQIQNKYEKYFRDAGESENTNDGKCSTSGTFKLYPLYVIGLQILMQMEQFAALCYER